MNTGLIVLIVAIVIAAAVLAALYFFGKRAQKKQDEQLAQIEATKQTVSMLIIDKKRLKAKDAGLPDIVTSQIPWYLKNSKLPVVKAKVGPQILSLISDEKIFDSIPVKKEVKASVSGIYIVGVKGLRGKAPVAEPQKKGFFKRLGDTIRDKASANPLK